MDKPSSSNKNSSSDNADDDEEIKSPKARLRSRGKKRKRKESVSSLEFEDMLPDNTLEVERNLQASAIKNNLDDASVKKILKKVVTNDHVLALVKLREEEELSCSTPEMITARHTKITRAKAKELMKGSPKSAPWNLELTPIKHIPVKTRPEVKALIAQELPEDEDDEEYEPTHDDVPSDDDQVSCSDLDSQPPTPATPSSLHTSSPGVFKDGPFKVPQNIATPTRRKLVIVEEGEEATIALRTRSKLSLSATPIEHIESSFVPPDDLPTPVGDDLWNKFLEECLNPAEVSKNEEDDEADPEYNVAADADTHDEDEEALENSLIKISKKELNDLVTELFSILPEPTDDQLAVDLANNVLTDHNAQIPSHWEGKQEPISDEEIDKRPGRITFDKRNSISRVSIGKAEPEDYMEFCEGDGSNEQATGVKEMPRCIVNVREGGTHSKPQTTTIDISVQEQTVPSVTNDVQLQPPPVVKKLQEPPATDTDRVTIQIDKPGCILPEQVQILQQHLRQHIQLATSNFLQLYVNPIHWTYAPTYKEYLEQFEKLHQDNPKSIVNVCNLKPALDLVRSWEKSVSEDTPENKKIVEFIQNEADKSRRRNQQNNVHIGEFPETFKRVIANSSVFLYPYLLPPYPYRPDVLKRFSYRRSEDQLIVLGIDQFWRYIEQNPELFPRPSFKHARHRWGLAATLRLVCKHMFPWITPRGILLHVSKARKDKDGPIYDYFKSGTIEPVKHKLLPFNPNLTLYEQPEHEMPRIWVRYLAKNSKRFKDFLYKRNNCGQPPEGVLIDMGRAVIASQKAALPIDFTKVIECSTRGNLLPKITVPTLHDKFDVHIENNVQIPSNNEVNNINIDTDNVINNTQGIPNFVNIAVTNVLPTNAKNICNLIPVVNSNLPVSNMMDNNATNDARSSNEVTDNTMLEIKTDTANSKIHNNGRKLPTDNLEQEQRIEDIGSNALNDTGIAKVSVSDLTNVQTIDTAMKGVPKGKQEIEKGEINNLNQAVADTANSKLPTNITKTIPSVTSNEIKNTTTNTSVGIVINTQNVTGNAQYVNTNIGNQQNTMVPPNMYTLIQTTAGSYIIPLSVLQKTNIATNVATPIVGTGVTAGNIIKVTVLNKSTIQVPEHSVPKNKYDYLIPDDTHKGLKDHCKCCIVLRKICKEKQTYITDFFTSNQMSKEQTCECSNRIYPKITKRLKLFLKNYKSLTWCVHKELQSKLKFDKKEIQVEKQASSSEIETLDDDYNLEDIAFVTSYQLKLTTRSNVIRDMAAKRKIQKILSDFDPETGNVLRLTEELYKAFGIELVDLYKEFLGFLTAEQANKKELFRDYFLHNCASDLIRKIEAEISDSERMRKILSSLNEMLVDRVSTSCQMCTGLLVNLVGYPKLARHVFSLFPHRARGGKHYIGCSSKTSPSNTSLIRFQATANVETLKQTIEPQIAEVSSLSKLLSRKNDSSLNTNAGISTGENMSEENTQRAEEVSKEIPNTIKENDTSNCTTVQAKDTENNSHKVPLLPLEEDDFLKDSLTICDENFVTKNYETDHSSSGEGDTERISECERINSDYGVDNCVIKNEEQPTNMDTSEITISKTEVQYHSDTTDLSTLAISEDESIKTEASEWKRDDDKLILQLLLQYLSPEQRKEKTIMEILDEKNVYQMIADTLTHKTESEIKNRVMYLLEILVMTEF